MEYIIRTATPMVWGAKYTIGLFLFTAILSLPLGLVLTFMRVSNVKIFKAITAFYVWIVRGTPLLLQLFFVYYALPFIPVVGRFFVFDRFPAACFTFALNYAAYFCEIFRGALLSVDKGQKEAARALGLSQLQITTEVIIPQMIKVALPSITNECITLVKDTALITAIGVTEILHYAKTAVNREVSAAPFAVAAVFYLVMNYGLMKVFEKLEKKYMFE